MNCLLQGLLPLGEARLLGALPAELCLCALQGSKRLELALVVTVSLVAAARQRGQCLALPQLCGHFQPHQLQVAEVRAHTGSAGSQHIPLLPPCLDGCLQIHRACSAMLQQELQLRLRVGCSTALHLTVIQLLPGQVQLSPGSLMVSDDLGYHVLVDGHVLGTALYTCQQACMPLRHLRACVCGLKQYLALTSQCGRQHLSLVAGPPRVRLDVCNLL
mmetsp:Transcript_94931/g.306469  ORF Transcript_94931/g.306469 Transcript_94931/m.306469 type:complete len:217 (-) Transcript_94931:751-1401(-)